MFPALNNHKTSHAKDIKCPVCVALDHHFCHRASSAVVSSVKAVLQTLHPQNVCFQRSLSSPVVLVFTSSPTFHLWQYRSFKSHFPSSELLSRITARLRLAGTQRSPCPTLLLKKGHLELVAPDHE